jgi:hypothetical protein
MIARGWREITPSLCSGRVVCAGMPGDYPLAALGAGGLRGDAGRLSPRCARGWWFARGCREIIPSLGPGRVVCAGMPGDYPLAALGACGLHGDAGRLPPRCARGVWFARGCREIIPSLRPGRVVCAGMPGDYPLAAPGAGGLQGNTMS